MNQNTAPHAAARLDENNDAKPLTTLVTHIPVDQDTCDITEDTIGDLDADELVCECGHEMTVDLGT